MALRQADIGPEKCSRNERRSGDYCHSLLDPKDGLPRIPAGKEAAREQEQLTEELALS